MRSAKLPECVYVCVPRGNASQAASPAFTAYGAESRPRSSPPTTRNYLCGQQSCPSVSKLVCRSVTLPSCEPGSHSLRSREPTSQLPTHHPKLPMRSAKLPECVYVWVPSGNAYQAASPALTSYGAESRPRSSPPTTRNYLCGQQSCPS